jgi:SAM-dependent methyltransferase
VTLGAAVASDKKWVLSRIPAGPGRALDLGGGAGELHAPLTSRGYEYANVDVAATGPGAVVGDAHELPFGDNMFDLVVSSDSLEHFHTPLTALREVARVLAPGGRLVVWVPFMHPFHRDDYYRYTPLGLEYLLEEAGFVGVSIEAPLGVFSIYAQTVVAMLQRIGLARLERPLEQLAEWLDARLRATHPGNAYAPFYLAVATTR